MRSRVESSVISLLDICCWSCSNAFSTFDLLSLILRHRLLIRVSFSGFPLNPLVLIIVVVITRPDSGDISYWIRSRKPVSRNKLKYWRDVQLFSMFISALVGKLERDFERTWWQTHRNRPINHGHRKTDVIQ